MGSQLRIAVMSCLAVFGAVWFSSLSPAAAQSAADKAAAEALFDRGLLLLKEGKYQEACERLEQSQSIERGIGTMLYLAECYEKVGRTASAWALFREAASWAKAEGQLERSEVGKRRAEKLEKDLSRLAVQVPEAHKVPGLKLSDNGAPLSAAVWGLSLPVDPGVHRIEASAPGYLTFASEVNVSARADSAEVRIPLLEKDPNAAVASAAPAPVEVANASAATTLPSAAPQPASSAPARMSNQRIAGIALGSVGLVGIVVGAITGGLAIKNNGDSKDHTANGQCIDDKCASLSRTALKQATASTVGWAVGGGLVAAGLITFLLGPKHQPSADVALSFDRQTAAMRVGGVF